MPDVLTIFRLWGSNMTNVELANALGVRVKSLWTIKSKYGLPNRPKIRRENEDEMPTEEEIAVRCAEVRRTWSREELARRDVYRHHKDVFVQETRVMTLD